MQKFRIIRSLLPIKFIYLEDKEGRLDYIGQILHQMGVPTKDCLGKPFKLPSQINRSIHPFTISIRNVYMDSKITIDILRLPPEKQSEAELQKILSTVGIQLVFED